MGCATSKPSARCVKEAPVKHLEPIANLCEISPKEQRKPEEGPSYREICISAPLACSLPSVIDAVAAGHSVLLLPQVATALECEALVCSATEAARTWSGEAAAGTQVADDGARLRFQADTLDVATATTCRELLRRVLHTVDRDLAQLVVRLFGDAAGTLLDVHSADRFVYGGGEPALNVYRAGGQFAPHKDMQTLTVLLPLSVPDDDFGGGGTEFWSTLTRGRVR